MVIVVSRSVGAVCHVGNGFDFAIIDTFFSSMLLLHPLCLPYHYMHCHGRAMVGRNTYWMGFDQGNYWFGQSQSKKQEYEVNKYHTNLSYLR